MHSECDLQADTLPPFPAPDPIRLAFYRLTGLRALLRFRRRRPLLSSREVPPREARLVQVVIGELTVRAEREEPRLLSALLTGKSASRDAGRELQPVFERLLATSKEEGRTLVLHFERLDYFNSSTIAALVQFIRTAQQAGVSLVVRYDAALKWQAMSFEALRRALKPFEAPEGPTLRFDGGDGPR
jgi:hypothetical protein